MTQTIYDMCKTKNFCPKHVAEVGVYLPETSNLLDFIQQNIRATLVEADPEMVERIRAYFRNQHAITIFPVAIFDYHGIVEFANAGASSFITTLEATPALVNDNYQISENNKFTVEAKRFDEIDDGTIDLLSIDIEGAEWYVIKHMKSRPSVISIETHGKLYTNPFLKDILMWMQDNNYQLWYKNTSDSVFIKKGVFEISFLEKTILFLANLNHSIRRIKTKSILKLKQVLKWLK
ncbi:methyltransferase, FkbM family [Thermoflexibacter ruber]|uniref:Methyltransferase, FkbM family n=2 Tax=Thermoflexibacter ruber TaxID=1003 RepID=A0A1I2K954_9BACT|nr:methyltransferase, FkbM family [Thermoflexibacter ruber]